ncbi:MAG: hypothetical protein K2X56_02930 [Mycobacterium pseudokansasii]|uniref:hypothetical protein n=1 Tax=Mycobacterium pseudokansasii TaxID=2341080 RepID=UPI000AC309F4|nr:hypothetical protein [Mycobacterium pseudokansasii]MBY0387081.1 hypothetical protein [Mycobacterium pseudokansasii]VAZ89227.1 hypothetical protein LAUMK35_00879 [Mycobacterium pseudokansasii]VAZ89894.1 hypothetical protein LAUMK21_00878 [Mycobacterium pseudokansasii]
MGVGKPARVGAASADLVTAVLTGGCGSDNPVIDSSNRGSNSHTKDTTVQNAYIVPCFQPGSCAIQVGDAAALAFTATNNRSTESEHLLSIATDAADAVHIAPAAPLEIPRDRRSRRDNRSSRSVRALRTNRSPSACVAFGNPPGRVRRCW